MNTYDFTIVASGLTPDDPGFDQVFYDAGCDDAVLAFQRGRIVLDFSREAKSFTHAVVSAIEDVTRVGVRIERVEPDCLVSLTDIAARSDLTKAAVSNYALGKRARDFPAPIARITSETPLWDWLEVARWMYRHERVGISAVIEARSVKALNDLAAQRAEFTGITAETLYRATRSKRSFADA